MGGVVEHLREDCGRLRVVIPVPQQDGELELDLLDDARCGILCDVDRAITAALEGLAVDAALPLDR